VLATCGIQSPDEAFENTQQRLLLLAGSEEGAYNLKLSLAHLLKGVIYTQGFTILATWHIRPKYAPLRVKILLTLLANIGGLV